MYAHSVPCARWAPCSHQASGRARKQQMKLFHSEIEERRFQTQPRVGRGARGYSTCAAGSRRKRCTTLVKDRLPCDSLKGLLLPAMGASDARKEHTNEGSHCGSAVGAGHPPKTTPAARNCSQQGHAYPRVPGARAETETSLPLHWADAQSFAPQLTGRCSRGAPARRTRSPSMQEGSLNAPQQACPLGAQSCPKAFSVLCWLGPDWVQNGLARPPRQRHRRHYHPRS